MTKTWLNDAAPYKIYIDAGKEMQFLDFPQRIKYITPGRPNHKPTFASAYFCSDFLPKQHIIEELNISAQNKKVA